MEKELKEVALDVTKNGQTGISPQNESKTPVFYDDDVLNRPRPDKYKFGTTASNLKLPVPQRNGFVRQWVIDSEQHVWEARGWNPVKGDDGEKMRAVMNRRKDKPDYGTYMEIPERWMQENLKDDDALRRDVLERKITNQDITSATLNKDGTLSQQSLDKSGFYTPTATFGENKVEKNNK